MFFNKKSIHEMLLLDCQSEIILVQGWQLVIGSKLFLFLPILFLVSTALAVLRQNVNQPATQTKEQKIDRKTKKIGIGNLSSTIEKKFPRNFFPGLFCFPLPSDKTSFLAAIWRQISRKASRALSRTEENKPSKMFSLIFLPKETPWLGIPGNFVFLSSLISISLP